MAEIFGNNRNEEFRNMVDDPFLNMVKRGNRPPKKRNYPFNANGYNDCCGFAASGDLDSDAVNSDPEPVVIKSKVQNMRAWDYAKTALALIGLYVVVTYAWGKLKK